MAYKDTRKYVGRTEYLKMAVHRRRRTLRKKEIDKCILVCANRHRELHAGILQPPIEISE